MLEAHVTEAKAAACYENLSVLYVAMTRAKRGLYVITKPPGESRSANFPRLLAETLGAATMDVRVGGAVLPGAWSAGDADWFTASRPKEEATEEARLTPFVGAKRAPRWLARRPSGEGVGAAGFAQLFSLERSGAMDFGTMVHRLLAEVEWGPVADIEARWAQRGEPADAAREAAAVLQAVGLASVWMRPTATSEVWRERAFEMLLDGVWITGVMDRVVVERDSHNRAVRATVYDFKTDRADETGLDEAAARHEGQMALYRQAAGKLTGLSVAAVDTVLVFTRARRLVKSGHSR